MEYIVEVEGNEYGPVNETELIKWAEEGRIDSSVKIRNQMLNTWKMADEFPFLSEIFKRQMKLEALSVSSDGKQQGDRYQQEKEIVIPGLSTSFENRYLPERAATLHRFQAGLLDMIIVLLVSGLGAVILAAVMSSAGFSPEQVFMSCFACSLLTVVIYFGAFLGVTAQTPGMWFFGLILVRNGDDAREVYLLRAYVYAILLLMLWVISPFTNYIIGSRRALHDILTDTQVVLISAKSK